MSEKYWWQKEPERVRQAVYLPRRQRTEEEVALDRRLEEQAKRAAETHVSKDEWARAQYRAASRAGATREQFEARYRHSDMAVMEAHVDQIFWQMVRMELRSNKDFPKWLEFIENFYEVPQHEFLERIKKRYWAQMQRMTDDHRHTKFLHEVFRAWRAAKEQIYDVDPAFDVRRQLEADAQQFAQRSWADRVADQWADISDLEMVQMLQQLAQE